MLQFITHRTERYDYLDSVRIALAGGCRWVQLRMKGKVSELGNSTKPLWTQIVRTIWLDQSSGGGYGWERRFPIMILGGFYFAGIY